MANRRGARRPDAGSTTAVLRSKLRAPTGGPHYIRRSRLLDLLDEVVQVPLTVVAAPAGAGKTALLSGWAAESCVPTAWLSLDETDRDGVQLWLGVVAALDVVLPGCGGRTRSLLWRRGRLHDAVRALLDELEQREVAAVLLIIDDVHVVDADPDAVDTLSYFVTHLPGWLHVVLSTRRSPSLPLERLRAARQVVEVRFGALRFTAAEARALLTEVAPSLAGGALTAAADEADGWAASLQLAALAARSQRSQEAVALPPLDEVSLVRDYVFNEVLAAEPPDDIDALLDLSVVARVNASVGEALTGRPDVGDLLARAEARGLFMARLGVDGWFALHSLVRSVLIDELAQGSPDRLAELHRRAGRWFESVGEVALALEHLLAAGAARDALRLLAAQHANLYDTGREAVTRHIVAAIPASVATADVDAMVEFAWCHLLVDRRRFLELVDQATWWAARSGIGVVRPRLTMLQSIAATVDGRWVEGGRLARDAMDQLGEGWWRDPLGRFGWNMVVRGVAMVESWDRSHPDVREAELALSRDPERRLAMEGTRALGEALAGRPLAALRVAAGVRRSAEVASLTILRIELAAAEAIAHRELGERAQALAELEGLAAAATETMLHCQLLAGTELVHAHLDAADEAAARRALDRAQTLVNEASFGSDAVEWLARAGAQLEVAVGDVDAAHRWAAQIRDPFWAGITTAWLRLAERDQRAAMGALDDLEPRCARHEVTLHLLRARASVDREETLKCATTAVEQAVEAGMLQTVASEGASLLDVIEQAAWRVPPGWLDRVRRAVARRGRPDDGEQVAGGLTERERDVLRFLPSRLTIAEIAQELYVSVNTLKFHLKVIYRKLGVSSRAEAAEVARQLTEVRRSP